MTHWAWQIDPKQSTETGSHKPLVAGSNPAAAGYLIIKHTGIDIRPHFINGRRWKSTL